MELEGFVELLTSKGVTFVIDLPDGVAGLRMHCLRPRDVAGYLADPVAYYASFAGVSKADYVEWEAAEGMVQCSAKTRKGKRCKGIVRDGYGVRPAEWLKKQGEYCPMHNGEIDFTPPLR